MSENQQSNSQHQGGCLCGAVRYSVAGRPIRVTNCYCRFCQRATGSTHMCEPIWPEDLISLLGDEPETYVTTSEGSGKQVYVHFCRACGTKLYLRFERFPDVVGVYGGTLDHPATALAGAEDSRIFLDEASMGSIIPAGVKTWRRHRMTNAGEPIEPTVFEQPLVV